MPEINLAKSNLSQTRALLDVVFRLRRECPWDKKQTHKSLIPYLLEEAYETIEAIEAGKKPSMREELGDLLLQIVLHAEIAAQKGEFSFEDVAAGITEKMIRRHPHVFGDAKVTTAEAQTRNWSKLKGQEKPDRGLLEGTPKSMPALTLAQRYGEIAASVNFDWPKLSQVMEKLDEELKELDVEIRRKPRKRADLEMELGDVLFVLTRVAAKLGLDAEKALRRANAKFYDRFTKLEGEVRRQNRKMSEMTLGELEKIWKQVKKAKTKKK